MSSISFYKYQSLGNDFILIDDPLSLEAHRIPDLCHRNFGIGADGLLLLEPSKIADVKMRIFNRDGKEASMCGNGLSCVLEHYKTSLVIETKGGISFGRYPGSISLPKQEVLSSLSLESGHTGYLVNTGTEHLVLFVERLDDPDLTPLGPLYRHHPLFAPKGVNVNFVASSPSGLHLRTYEKGVEEETLACGSGAAAAFLAYKTLHPQIQSELVIHPSGQTSLLSQDEDGLLWMKSSAYFVFQGVFPLF